MVTSYCSHRHSNDGILGFVRPVRRGFGNEDRPAEVPPVGELKIWIASQLAEVFPERVRKRGRRASSAPPLRNCAKRGYPSCSQLRLLQAAQPLYQGSGPDHLLGP